MLIEQVKATLAIENLHLSKQEEQILKDYAQGLITIEQVLSFFPQLLSKEQKAA